MEANECRLNNILDYRGQTTVLTKNEMVHFYRFTEEYKPIPITKEILLKCPQFYFDDMQDSNDDNTWFWFKYKSFSFGADKSSNFESVFIRLNKEIIEIKYLHDLQNMVKSLTNNELIITQ